MIRCDALHRDDRSSPRIGAGALRAARAAGSAGRSRSHRQADGSLTSAAALVAAERRAQSGNAGPHQLGHHTITQLHAIAARNLALLLDSYTEGIDVGAVFCTPIAQINAGPPRLSPPLLVIDQTLCGA